MKDNRLLPGIEVANPRRLVAAFLGVFLLIQCLPLTIPAPADFREGAKVEVESFIEILQVCDHGESAASYFADHPWIPGTAFFFSSYISGLSFLAAPVVGLARGFPPAVYKPPRASFS